MSQKQAFRVCGGVQPEEGGVLPPHPIPTSAMAWIW